MIVVCGEALIDQFLARTDRARADLLAVAGGSPFNVAIGISRQGIKSAFHGGISKDPFGEMLAGCLQRDKVSLKLAHRSGRPTPLMIVATDPAGVPTYTFHGERAAHTDLPVMKLPAEVEAITFGSFSIAADPAGETYVKLAEAEAGNRVISIDPNVRPMAITDMALWEERFHRILKTATIVKASIEDIELLYGHGASVAKVAENWRSEGPALVIVTYGEGGAVGYGYEQDIELVNFGAAVFYNRRKIDGLKSGTPRQMPVPAKELQVLQRELYSFGGPGKPDQAPGVDGAGQAIRGVRDIWEEISSYTKQQARRRNRN